jgi:Domain of Unknown Function (DUF1080)
MKPLPRTALLSYLLLVVAIGGPALIFAADEFKPEPGYTSLFNGKELTGWQFVPRKPKEPKESLDGKTESANKRFQVVDGVIVANVGRGIEDLYTIKEYNKDFHLKLEFRAAPRADSGVYIRGPQLQVRDYPTVGPYKKLKNFKNGDWNLLDITVKGTTALCKCNDEVIEPAFKVPAKGRIGLQAEVGKFEFRHLQIKEFP